LAGKISQAIDVLTVAAHMINKPLPSESERAAASQSCAGKAASKDLELRASEDVVSAAVDTIMIVLLDLRRQEADGESGECWLSNAWQVLWQDHILLWLACAVMLSPALGFSVPY